MENLYNSTQSAMSLDDPETTEIIEVTIENIGPLVGKMVKILEIATNPEKLNFLIGQRVKVCNKVFFIQFKKEHYLIPYNSKISILKTK